MSWPLLIYCVSNYINLFILYADVADGVNTPSPVTSSIDVNKIPPTPTMTVATPSFRSHTNGKHSN